METLPPLNKGTATRIELIQDFDGLMLSKKPVRVVLSSQMSAARIKLPLAALAWFMLNLRGLWEGGREAAIRCD